MSEQENWSENIDEFFRDSGIDREAVDELLACIHAAIASQDEWRIVLLNDAAVSGPTGF